MSLATSTEIFDVLEEPRIIVEKIIPKFEPANDVALIARINKSLHQMSLARQQKIDHLKENLKNLSRKVELLRWESQRPSHLSEEFHNQKLDELERIKFMLAKNIQENDSSLQNYENELENLRSKMANLEKNENLVQQTTDLELQLNLFRAFGIELVASNDTKSGDLFCTAVLDAEIGSS